MKHRVSCCFDRFMQGFCTQAYTKHFKIGILSDGIKTFTLGIEVRQFCDSIQFYLSLGWISFFFIITTDWFYGRKYTTHGSSTDGVVKDS